MLGDELGQSIHELDAFSGPIGALLCGSGSIGKADALLNLSEQVQGGAIVGFGPEGAIEVLDRELRLAGESADPGSDEQRVEIVGVAGEGMLSQFHRLIQAA